MSHEATELELYMMNTNSVYLAYVVPTLRMLSRHWKRGNFDKDKALKAFLDATTQAAKSYAREHGSMFDSWSNMFSLSDRKRVDESLFDMYIVEIKAGDYLKP